MFPLSMPHPPAGVQELWSVVLSLEKRVFMDMPRDQVFFSSENPDMGLFCFHTNCALMPVPSSLLCIPWGP